MYGDDGDIALVGPVQRVEMGQLGDAGRAVGRPEVDEGDLSAGVGKVEL